MGEGKILLNTGSSGKNGWSSISRSRCLQLYFWHEQEQADGVTASPELRGSSDSSALVRGSIIHVALAHLYARQRASQLDGDPDRFYKPMEAMERVAKSFGEVGAEMLPIATAAVRGYVERYFDERLKIVAVERLVEIEFTSSWGSSYPYTARIDLEYEDRSGKIWIMDHKSAASLRGSVYSRYTLSGQILGLMHIGSREYGDRFGGVQLNLIGLNPQAYDRVVPDPAPWMLQRFPGVVARMHEGIEMVRDELARDPKYVIPATPSEVTCVTTYGLCPMFDLCRWGK